MHSISPLATDSIKPNSIQHRSIFFIDFLRFFAAIAVVAIHVLGPYRELVSELATNQWLPAVVLNSVSRWAVPIFIMVSGALLISSFNKGDTGHYFKRRILKVILPFIIWTIVYALIGGLDGNQWSWADSAELIEQSPTEQTWYHLWFFYEFIPLYLLIPFLAPLLHKISSRSVTIILFGWLLLTLVHWLHIDTPLQQDIILYSGYLIAGWYLFNTDQRPYLKWWLLLGCSMLAFNIIGSWFLAIDSGHYRSTFMGYKSLNTVFIAASLFVFAKYSVEKINLSEKWRSSITLISKYSLGIYLIHPIFLIPVRNISNGFYDWFGHPAIAIPALTITVLLASLLASYLLGKTSLTRWMVP